MTKTALETVQGFHHLMENESSEWQDCFTDDIVFKGPVDTVVGKEANIELNKNFIPLMKGYEPLNVFEQGKFVSLEGKYFVKTPAGRTINFDASEVYEVEDGKIKNIRIYYDAEEFRNEFGKN